MSKSTLKSMMDRRPRRKGSCIRWSKRVEGEWQKHTHEAISKGRAEAEVGECDEMQEQWQAGAVASTNKLM